ISVNGGSWRDRGFRFTTHWARRYARVRAQGEIPITRKRAHRPVGVQNKNELGDLRADLRTPARAARADEGRAGPAVARAGDYDSLAAFAAQAEAHFDHGEDREPLGVAHHAPRNPSFRHPLELAEDRGRL